MTLADSFKKVLGIRTNPVDAEARVRDARKAQEEFGIGDGALSQSGVDEAVAKEMGDRATKQWIEFERETSTTRSDGKMIRLVNPTTRK